MYVLLPAQVLPRCSSGVELVGQVLLAAAAGAGHRAIAAGLSLSPDTLRRWLRRARANAARANAEWLRQTGVRRAHESDADRPLLRDRPTWEWPLPQSCTWSGQSARLGR